MHVHAWLLRGSFPGHSRQMTTHLQLSFAADGDRMATEVVRSYRAECHERQSVTLRGQLAMCPVFFSTVNRRACKDLMPNFE